MRSRSASLILSAASAFAATCGGVVTEAEAAGGVLTTLSITGHHGARANGQCFVTDADGERKVRIDQALPIEHRWQARRVRCELDVHGSVKIEVVRDGTHDTFLTDGGRITFDLS